MDKYEYTILKFPLERAIDITFTENMLNNMGQKHWELVSVIENKIKYATMKGLDKLETRFYFKRKLS